jgi:hypothetical protein
VCTAFPTFDSTRLLGLYEVRSRVRPALTSIGSALDAKITVEAIPASTWTSVVAMARR